MRSLTLLAGFIAILLILFAGQAALAPVQAIQPTQGVPIVQGVTATPTQIMIVPPAETIVPTLTPFPTNTPRFSPTPTLVTGDHFWFSRPFAYDATGRVIDYPARGYAYGSKGGGGLSVHHGIDIENPTGTFVQAVADGTVVFAGDDLSTTIGIRPDFYGNAIIIEHDFLSPDGLPVYSLYGHLSRVDVSVGERVQRFQQIGAVGAEGVAFGPHLHLEVRIGNPYDYNSTFNPELWVEPWKNFGVFAARIVDSSGEPIYGVRVELIGQGRFFTGWTYGDLSVNSDVVLGENIVIGDMPAGEYDIKVGEIREVRWRGTVTIEPDTVNFIEIVIP